MGSGFDENLRRIPPQPLGPDVKPVNPLVIHNRVDQRRVMVVMSEG